MAVKVLIKRKIKNGKMNEASKLLIKVRYAAMGQPGYISSETLTDCNDPNNVAVISMWQKIENWNQWKNTDVRSEIDAEFEAVLDESTQYEYYNLGLVL